MQCPECDSPATRVLDSRKKSREGKHRRAIIRRRECMKCGERFSTTEVYSGRLHDDLDTLSTRLDQAAAHVRRIGANRFLSSE